MGFDGFDGPDDAEIMRGEKADHRHRKQAGVKMFGAIKLHKGIEISVKAFVADVLVDTLSKRLPSANISTKPALLG